MTGDKAVKLAFLLQATDKMSETLEKAGENLTKFQKTLAERGAKALKTGGYFITLGNQIGGGMLNVVRAATDYGDSAIKTAQRVGMQTEAWQKLAYAAEFAGVENEQLASGMAKFDKVLVAASEGTGTSAQAFKKLGINIKDASGKMRATQDILSDVSNVFSHMEDGAEKSALAQELFGKSGAQLIPLLNSGAKGLAEMGKEAEDMGLVLSEEATKACERFNDNLERVSKATLGLKIQIGAALMPILERLINIVTAGIKAVAGFAKEHQTLTTIIGGVIAGIGALLFGIGAISLAFGASSYVILQFVKAWKAVITVINWVKTTMLFFKAVIHGTNRAMYSAALSQKQFTIATKLHAAGVKIAAVAQQVWNWAVIQGTVALDKLRYGVIGTTVKKVALAIASGVSTAAQWLWNAATTAGSAVIALFTTGIILTGIKLGFLAVWQGIVTVAQWLFNAALYACPVVWIVAAIMAIIAAVVLMVKYWDNIVAFFGNIWDGIVGAFSAAWEWFASLPEKFAQFGRNIIQGLINGILSAVSKVWEIIKNIGKKIGGFFSKILGINSPSTVFAKYGMNITQGLVVGIDRGEGNVEHATEGLATQAVNGYGEALQVQTVPAGGGGGMMGGMAGGGAFNYSPTINIGAGVTEGTKQDFAKLLRDHYREIVDIMQRFSENKARLSYNT
jgi:hypothetical protein